MADKDFVPKELLGETATDQFKQAMRKRQSAAVPNVVKQKVNSGNFPFFKFETSTNKVK